MELDTEYEPHACGSSRPDDEWTLPHTPKSFAGGSFVRCIRTGHSIHATS